VGICSDSNETLMESRQSFSLFKHLNLMYSLPYFANLGVVMLLLIMPGSLVFSQIVSEPCDHKFTTEYFSSLVDLV